MGPFAGLQINKLAGAFLPLFRVSVPTSTAGHEFQLAYIKIV